MGIYIFYILILLHVLGATIWVGGHLILAFSYLPDALKRQSITELQNFEDKFERIGIPALIIQIITGVFLAFHMNPNWTQWFNMSGSIRGIGIKLLLLLLTAILAVDARFRIIPNLTLKNLNSLVWHIVPVTIIGVLFVVVGVFFRIGGI
jgi:putative copper export protein